jgi:hypothetical protein
MTAWQVDVTPEQRQRHFANQVNTVERRSVVGAPDERI